VNFTGSDTYFNGSFTLTAVSSTQIQFALTHFNAVATSNGGAIMKPTSSQGCAPQVNVYSDQALTALIAQPFSDDGHCNVGFWAAPGTYYVAYSASGLSPMPLNIVALPCPSGGTCTHTSLTILSRCRILAGTQKYR
jgi:hypothetical protein